MIEGFRRDLKYILHCILKVFIKTFWGSEEWCRRCNHHVWDVIATDYEPFTRDFRTIEVTCLECGKFQYFNDWQTFATWAVDQAVNSVEI